METTFKVRWQLKYKLNNRVYSIDQIERIFLKLK